jgi:hypothetical protein
MKSAMAPTQRPPSPAERTDIELLRAYEPIIAYTKGEWFYPTDVDGYVRCCGLWGAPAGADEAAPIVPAGELSLDRLAAAGREYPDREMHLLFVQKPFSPGEVHRWRRRTTRPAMPRGGRLAVVGLVGRLIDIGMRASLLLRGRVPGGVAAAAASLYQERLDRGDCTYYGRVIRDGGYTVCQYWFFYPMNDWRTNFAGVNDHEADWEMVSVFLVGEDGGTGQAELRPAWVAVSTHDGFGDDLRRRWDDPDLRRVGDHPVVFAGAGSHSGAVLPGDYLVRVNPAALRGPLRAVQRVTAALFPWTGASAGAGLGIPFIDYARGDGIQVGPGGDRVWRAVRIDDETPWVHDYRGLWGRDPRDRFGGERAPAGPRYDRGGRVRAAWADPLGWAGLQKISPDSAVPARDLAARVAVLEERIAAADEQIAADRAELRLLRATALSLGRHANTRALARARFAEVAAAEQALAERCRVRTELAEERTAHLAAIENPGRPEEPQAHLREPHLPHAVGHRYRNRFARGWAAVSTPLLILTIAGVLLLVQGYLVFPLLALALLVFAAVEAVARRKLLAFAGVVVVLCGAAAVGYAALRVMAYNWRLAVLVPLALVGVVVLVGNVRDLFRD